MLFVLSGFEHSIANMYYLSLAKLLGFNCSWQAIIVNNLLPVTLGNIIGGAAIIPIIYYLAYGKTEKQQEQKLSLLPFMNYKNKHSLGKTC